MRTTKAGFGRKILFLAGLMLSTVAPRAFADGYLRLGALYSSHESGADNKSTTTRTLLDIGAGYIWPKGWSLGLLYGTDKQTVTGQTASERKAYGPTFGWISRREHGAYVLATYFLSAETDTLGGSGYQVDLGYRFKLRKVYFAPQISYRGLTFDETDTGQKIEPAHTETRLDPYFVIWAEF